jgi:hypothetical protein
MILINGCSFTTGEESSLAWPSLINKSVNIAQAGASNDYILRSTVDYILQEDPYPVKVIVAWTTPNRIEISNRHLTPTSTARYGNIVNEVFAEWDEEWARKKFLAQAELLHNFLYARLIPHFFISAFDIQPWATGTTHLPWLGWPDQGLVEWMGDCAKGPGGHPLEVGHQRIAEHINEYIRNLGWVS